MKVHLLKPRELSDSLIRDWSEIQRREPEFDSPYFRPEFTLAVSEVRRGVEVAVIEIDSRIVGFFPFERWSKRVADPVGGRLSDYQAVIKRRGVVIEPRKLVESCKLSAWDFDHLLCSQTEFSEFHYATDGSPFLDLTGGFANYCRLRRELGDEELQQTQKRAKQLCREVGELRVVSHCQDVELLDLMLKWKSEQYRRTRITDVFSFPWTRELLRGLMQRRAYDFGGMLSVLFVKDQPVAIHMGMCSAGVLHYWFPTYDQQLAKYSPGRVLLLELARFSQEIGIQKIDMGRGMAPYKTRVMTGFTSVALGSVDVRPVTNAVRVGWKRAQDWVRQSPLRQSARLPGRVLYHMREWLEFR